MSVALGNMNNQNFLQWMIDTCYVKCYVNIWVRYMHTFLGEVGNVG